MVLKRISCIHYPLRFRKDKKNKVRILINSGSKVNAMSSQYASKLSLKVQRTNVGAQKIDGSIFKTFGMVLANFQVEDKQGRA